VKLVAELMLDVSYVVSDVSLLTAVEEGEAHDVLCALGGRTSKVKITATARTYNSLCGEVQCDLLKNMLRTCSFRGLYGPALKIVNYYFLEELFSGIPGLFWGARS
jgi:hypothetical protein